MARTLNKVMLLGRLGKDPEMKYVPSGTAITTVSLATNHRRKNGDTWEEETEWHALVAFDKLAETLNEYGRKGSLIYVEGRLQTRSWEQDGQKRYKTEIVINELILLDSKDEGRTATPAARFAAVASDDATDDLPF